MAKRKRDVAEEFRFYLRGDLPGESLQAWYESLSEAEQLVVQGYAREAIAKVASVIGDIREAFVSAGQGIMEGLQPALKELGIGQE